MQLFFRVSNKALKEGKHVPWHIQSTISTNLHSQLVVLLEATLIFFFTDIWKGASICQSEVSHIWMSILFPFCHLDDYTFLLLMKRQQRNSSLKSSLSEFNIKWVTLQPHKLWDWQSDLLISWIKLPIRMHVDCSETNAFYVFLWK